MELETKLKGCIGNQVCLIYLVNNGEKESIHGVLKNVSKDLLEIESFDVFRNLEKIYINRRACTLLKLQDYGKESTYEKDRVNGPT